MRSGLLIRFFLSALAAAAFARAAEPPAGGVDMLATVVVRAYPGRAAELGATAETVPVTGQDFPNAQRLVLPQQPTNPWDAGARSLLTVAVEAGDTGLVLFKARAVPLPGAPAEAAATAEASGHVYLEDAEPPAYAKSVDLAFKTGPEWTEFVLPWKAEIPLAVGRGSLVFHLGAKAQALEFGPVRVLSYGKSKVLRELPRSSVTYPGRAADAPWRKEALERIEKIRTAPLTVKVTDAAGQPVSGAEVRARLLRHAFGFGTAVTAKLLAAEGAEADRYRETVRSHFSRAVFENDMKMEFWEQSLENKPGHWLRWEDTVKACDWLTAEGIGLRGHYLSWAPWEDWSRALRGQPDKIKERVLVHIPRVASQIGDRVMEWDAINHLAGWDKNIDEVTGLDFYSDIMRASRAATKLPLWVNEDQVFRPGRQREDYFTRIQKLIADGCKPDGIGNQAHFDSSFLPGPKEMWEVSERFAALVPALQITEFDVDSNGDEQLEADYLRDCLILTYSHPAYTGFVLWGFWEGAHWRPDSALWRKDWSEKPSAAVWKQWVNAAWSSSASGVTAAESGEFSARGHFGVYEIIVSAGGKTAAARASLGKDGATVTVALP